MSSECRIDIHPSSLALQDLCLWSDQSMAWEEPDITQEYDAVDKDSSACAPFRWEYVPARTRAQARCQQRAFILRRVRLPLSVLHPMLRDIVFWTLDLRSTVLLFVVLTVLVSFGAAIFG